MQYMFIASAALLSAVASAADITVTVGPDLKFHPDTITASKGDTVSFKIGSDHNVQSGEFGSPCVNSNGFSSGGSFNGDGFNSKVFRVEINDTSPIYGFCGEEGHCQAGMTYTINAPTSGDQTGDAYRKAAQGTSDSTPFRSVRGGQYVAPGSSSGGSGSSSASSSASVSTSSESSSAAASSKPSSAAVTPEATPSSTKTILSTASSAAAGAASPSGGSVGTTGLAGGATGSGSAPIETFTGAAVPGQNGREGFATAAVMFFASVMAWFL